MKMFLFPKNNNRFNIEGNFNLISTKVSFNGLPWKSFFSVSIFAFVFYVGIKLAKAIPFSGDEVYTLNNITADSLRNILFRSGAIRTEGNSAPLFYLIQKAFGQLGIIFGIKWLCIPVDVFKNAQFQVWFRIPSIFYIASAISFSFYFYSRYFSSIAGFLSLVSSVSSAMVWLHCAESRPYALWFLLTTLHIAFFLKVIGQENDDNTQAWRWLIAVQFLLSLLIFFSFIQIVSVCFVLWMMKHRKKKIYFLFCIIQLLICFGYYILSPYYSNVMGTHLYFAKAGTPLNLFFANFPPDRLIFIVIFISICSVFVLEKKPAACFFDSSDAQQMVLEGKYFFLLCSIVLVATVAVMIKLKLGEDLIHAGPMLSNRYFMYLTPFSIATSSIFPYLTYQILKQRRQQLLCFGFVLIVIASFLFRVYKTYLIVGDLFAL